MRKTVGEITRDEIDGRALGIAEQLIGVSIAEAIEILDAARCVLLTAHTVSASALTEFHPEASGRAIDAAR
jgi:hypothetical protein